jgi:hypothetical protein
MVVGGLRGMELELDFGNSNSLNADRTVCSTPPNSRDIPDANSGADP